MIIESERNYLGIINIKTTYFKGEAVFFIDDDEFALLEKNTMYSEDGVLLKCDLTLRQIIKIKGSDVL